MDFGEFSEFTLRNRRPITLNYVREKYVTTHKCVCNFHVPCGIEATTENTQTLLSQVRRHIHPEYHLLEVSIDF